MTCFITTEQNLTNVKDSLGHLNVAATKMILANGIIYRVKHQPVSYCNKELK